jgi:hypothetical protein
MWTLVYRMAVRQRDAAHRLGRECRSVTAIFLGARKSGKNANATTNSRKIVEIKDAQLRATMDAPRTRVILLSACETVSSNPACICPPIKEYSARVSGKVAAEIDAAPENAVFPEAVMDYASLRAQLTHCR